MSSSNPQHEFKLKALTPGAIPAALERAERYRLLHEPVQAESICLDILRTEPDHPRATVLLLLALTDQFADALGENWSRAMTLLPRLPDDYQRAYYRGILHERQARVILARASPGAGPAAYEHFRTAMDCYEQAEQIRPSGNDEALLRWNTCARTLMSANLEPAPADDARFLMLE